MLVGDGHIIGIVAAVSDAVTCRYIFRDGVTDLLAVFIRIRNMHERILPAVVGRQRHGPARIDAIRDQMDYHFFRTDTVAVVVIVPCFFHIQLQSDQTDFRIVLSDEAGIHLLLRLFIQRSRKQIGVVISMRISFDRLSGDLLRRSLHSYDGSDRMFRLKNKILTICRFSAVDRDCAYFVQCSYLLFTA